MYGRSATPEETQTATCTCLEQVETRKPWEIGRPQRGQSRQSTPQRGEPRKGGIIITPYDQPTITVETLEMAQFISLLLKNKPLRDVINPLTSKVVLILGRFSDERKPVLDALRDGLRKHDYLPVVFDFEKAAGRDLTETFSTLAHPARFIIVNPADPNSAPHEMATLVPHCVVPVQPLLIEDDSRNGDAMFQDLRQHYHWVLPAYHYQDTASLLASFKEHLITPTEQKAQELEQRTPGK